LKISGVFVALAGFVAMLGGACSSNKDPSTYGETTSSSATGTMSGPTGAGGSGNTGPCVNLQCQQTTCTLGSCKEMPCAAGTRTSVSGIVYDPAGKVPLYNVIVYVPNQAPAPFAAGATCDRCSASDLHAVV